MGRLQNFAVAVLLAGLLFAAGSGAVVAEAAADDIKPVLTLTEATMCEGIESYMPKSPAVVFSVSTGRLSCFTAFDPVPRKAIISHRWYFRDQLITTKRLHLRPPKWATYSSIQPRQTDIGPWRVEVVDPDGAVMQTLRFSIVQ